jgi:hypothetical protein
LWLAHKEDPKLSEKPHLVKAHLVSAPDFGLTFDLLLAGVSGSCDGRQLEAHVAPFHVSSGSLRRKESPSLQGCQIFPGT